MKHHALLFLLSALALPLLFSCKGGGKGDVRGEENAEAKRMLQGVWIGEDDAVMMRVKGDSITYADSTMATVAFAIVGDSLVMHGYRDTQYAIVKQTPHLFVFRNQTGDVVRLVKSDNRDDNAVFDNRPKPALNQRRLIKRDTIVTAGERRYHVYTQVNPSTYKVVRTTLNQDGVQVDNVYYDNIINICVYDGARRLFSRDIRKQDFKRHVPGDYLAQSVLSDITVTAADTRGVSLEASVCVPDSYTSYIIDLNVSPAGHLSMKARN